MGDYKPLVGAPEYMRCVGDGSVVVDTVAHDEFHTRLERLERDANPLVTVDAIDADRTSPESAAEPSKDESEPVTLTMSRKTLDALMSTLGGVIVGGTGYANQAEFEATARQANFGLHDAVWRAGRKKGLPNPVWIQGEAQTTADSRLPLTVDVLLQEAENGLSPVISVTDAEGEQVFNAATVRVRQMKPQILHVQNVNPDI